MKASDNVFPSVIFDSTSGTPEPPAENTAKVFIDPETGNLFRMNDDTTSRGVMALLIEISQLSDPSSATTEDCANKINEILSAFAAAGFNPPPL